MIISRLLISLALACSLWACTSSTLDRPGEHVPGLDLAEPEVAERLIEPTAAMLAAALAGDPQQMQEAAALSSCVTPSSCPAGYTSCSTWSAPEPCNFSCEPAQICRCPIRPDHPDLPPEECPPPSPWDPKLGRTTYNAFRVCFNSAQQACTEWKQTSSSHCGC